MTCKNDSIIQEMELQNIVNKVAFLFNDKQNIDAYEIENLFIKLDSLANDAGALEDAQIVQLSNCYVEFLKCISIYLVNVNFCVQDFAKLNKWIQIIYDKPSGTQLAQIFTKDIALPISEEVCNNFLHLGIENSISLLYFINSVAEKDMLNRHLISNKLLRLRNLYNAICLCGDYVLQSNFLKFMINICSTIEKSQFASKLFNENQYLEKAFVKTNVYDFEDPARVFLTIVNQKFKRVSSVRAKYLKMDNVEIYVSNDREDYYSVWFDVNKTSRTISLSCNIKTLPEHLVSKGNGKVGNEFIIFNFNQIIRTACSRLTYFDLQYSCLHLDLRKSPENQKFTKLCLKFVNLKDMTKVEEEVYLLLKEATRCN